MRRGFGAQTREVQTAMAGERSIRQVKRNRQSKTHTCTFARNKRKHKDKHRGGGREAGRNATEQRGDGARKRQKKGEKRRESSARVHARARE